MKFSFMKFKFIVKVEPSDEQETPQELADAIKACLEDYDFEGVVVTLSD